MSLYISLWWYQPAAVGKESFLSQSVLSQCYRNEPPSATMMSITAINDKNLSIGSKFSRSISFLLCAFRLWSPILQVINNMLGKACSTNLNTYNGATYKKHKRFTQEVYPTSKGFFFRKWFYTNEFEPKRVTSATSVCSLIITPMWRRWCEKTRN